MNRNAVVIDFRTAVGDKAAEEACDQRPENRQEDDGLIHHGCG